MGKEKHNFREFFYLCAPDNPKANKKAVCFSCIRKYTLITAITKPECFVSNKAILCRNHLKKCENFASEYSEDEKQEILSRKVPEDAKKNKEKQIVTNLNTEERNMRSGVETNNMSSIITKQQNLSGFVSWPMSKKDVSHFENLILLMMVSNGLSFTFLENKETQDVFRCIAPTLKLPGRKAISDRVLSISANQLTESIVAQAKADIIGVTAAFDGWTNIKQEHLFGVVFITSSGKTLIWGAKDISNQRSKTEDVKALIKSLMNNAESKQIKINCFVSDSAGEYAAARRQLRIEYPNKIFLPCMAHQMNLVVGDIFKESLQYWKASKDAVRLVSYFHSSTYFTGLLRNEQMSCYGQTIALITPGETRWNSYYFCFHSVLKTEAALKALITKCSPERIGTPSTSRTGLSHQRYRTNTNNNENNYKNLPPDVIGIVNNVEFWIQLYELQNLLLPLCGALNKLQKDVARLYEIILCFGWIIKIFSSHENEEFGNCMVTRLESRWAKWEQPLLLLSIILHPKHPWFNEMPKSILREYLSYQRKNFPFNPETYNQFDENIIDFWESARGLAPELSRLALQLFGICINAASVERLWSNMGFLHLKRRNKLHYKKVLAMAQLRSDILHKRKREDTEKYERQYKRIHIAEPIQEYEDEESEENEEFAFNAFDTSDTEESEEFEDTFTTSDKSRDDIFENTNNGTNILNSEQWIKMIEHWIELVDTENHLDNDDVINEETYNFEVDGQDTHPADNPLAKWKLLDLFNESLEMPVYVSSMINLN
ncbi:ribonuclease H-like domain-containing protein [Rhizophagus clarus]|uniref:Ribonuclease H-like domain-containing protein n=2 Tax=Rhizophagus clarus TaxID=94130 RepID=A0A8H3LZH0_9GLOM|nr:ribonuclease H-like domain-containing protein [Rhizophagus clarus]